MLSSILSTPGKKITINDLLGLQLALNQWADTSRISLDPNEVETFGQNSTFCLADAVGLWLLHLCLMSGSKEPPTVKTMDWEAPGQGTGFGVWGFI